MKVKTWEFKMKENYMKNGISKRKEIRNRGKQRSRKRKKKMKDVTERENE